MTRLRGLAMPLAVIATVLLVYLVNPLANPDGALRQVVTVLFWIAAILLVLALFEDRKHPEGGEVEIEGPRFARFLFNNSRAGLLWLPIRLFVGFAWLESGLHKLGDPAWTQGGQALTGLLGARRRHPGGSRSSADHVRVVPRLHQHAAGWRP
jgi:hypothetical protein